MTEPPSKSGQRTEREEARRRKEQREEERRARRLERAAELRQRRAAWQARLSREVLHAGESVSSLLADRTSSREALEKRGLPVLEDAADLARLLEIELSALRWLTYHRSVATVTHYRQFAIPKAKGGTRTISAPRPKLRAAQQAIRARILSRLVPTAHAHAFVPGRSTLTNATPHLKRALVVKLDLSDFFGTITFPRVRGFFKKLGYSGMVATLLALLTTESRRTKAVIDGRTFYVSLGARALPQGAPTSPELTNQIARRLDARLAGWAKKSGWTYTRYADDLTFSRDSGEREHVGRLLGLVRAVLEGEGFRLNPDKVFVARRGRQQRVTGIVVNDVPGIARAKLRRFRAAVHRVSHDGFRDESERRQMLGYASYVKMVKPALGEKLLATLAKVSP
jgi:retron-type reverse transcriptase